MSDLNLDIAIIGGGIVGAACAYYLSDKGISCSIIESEGVGSKASGLAYGGLNPVSGFEIPGLMWELSQYSSILHTELEASLGGSAVGDCKYRARDTLNLAFSARELSELRKHARWIDSCSHFSSTVLKPSEIFEVEPRVSGLVIGGTLTSGTREVDSHSLTVALALASGCRHIQAHLDSMKFAENKINLVLDDGSELRASTVIFSNGTWITPLLRTIGINLEIPPLKGEILRLKTKGVPLDQSIGWKGNYCTTKNDGLTWAGTTESWSLYDESTTTQGRLSILSNLRVAMPNLVVHKIVRQTACLRPTTIDGLPAIGQLPSHPNLLVATGAGRKGILYGPAMGKLVADIVAGIEPELDIKPFRAGRLVSNT
ncbi:MAG: FAD-binding oxidoreductase [Gammaproteobacteria bacterium]|nr:FAD-binding oxidoreductase [Gammaproteobacteria bacterium]